MGFDPAVGRMSRSRAEGRMSQGWAGAARPLLYLSDASSDAACQVVDERVYLCILSPHRLVVRYADGLQVDLDGWTDGRFTLPLVQSPISGSAFEVHYAPLVRVGIVHAAVFVLRPLFFAPSSGSPGRSSCHPWRQTCPFQSLRRSAQRAASVCSISSPATLCCCSLQKPPRRRAASCTEAPSSQNGTCRKAAIP